MKRSKQRDNVVRQIRRLIARRGHRCGYGGLVIVTTRRWVNREWELTGMAHGGVLDCCCGGAVVRPWNEFTTGVLRKLLAEANGLLAVKREKR
jgi:hypothetical protein